MITPSNDSTRESSDDKTKTSKVSRARTPKKSPSFKRASSDAPLVPLRSPAVNRNQLYSTFLDVYLPQTGLPHERSLETFHFDYIKTLATGFGSNPALSYGLDALSLVQIGSIQNDKRLLQSGVEAYTRSLKYLAHALTRPDSARDDGILAAATVLSMCELYSIVQQKGQAWVNHHKGMQNLIAARGPDAVNSRLGQLLVWNSRNSSLACSLLLRKKDFFAASRWQTTDSVLSHNDDYWAAYATGLKLPELLERSDNLDVHQPNALTDLDALLSDCERLESDMRDYLNLLESNTADDDSSLFILENVETFSPFAERVSDRTLTKAFKFPSFMTGFLHCQSWLRLYLLRASMQSLHNMRRELVPDWIPENERRINENELLGYIFNLCRCVPFFLEPENAMVGHVCCFFPLHVAAYYFRDHEYWPWLRWVREVRNSVFDKGLSMPEVRRPELPPECPGEVDYVGSKIMDVVADVGVDLLKSQLMAELPEGKAWTISPSFSPASIQSH